MKLLISGLVLGLLIFSSCDNIQDSLTSSDHLEKNQVTTSEIGTSDLGFSIIPLPERSLIYQDSTFRISRLINGLLGGTITLNRSYISKEGKLVTVLVEMVFQPLSFSGQRLITVEVNDSLAVMDCEPGMNFRRPVILFQTFTGVDLSGYRPEEIEYAYINDNGSYYPIQGLKIINKELGILTIAHAKLYHFSRYGWVRKSGNDN